MGRSIEAIERMLGYRDRIYLPRWSSPPNLLSRTVKCVLSPMVELVLIMMAVSTDATSQEELTYCIDMRGSVVMVLPT
jgi:hypothetical protein